MESALKQWILDRAYVPEHVVGLMEGVSGGEALLERDFLGCCKGRWFALVGYPLDNTFSVADLESAIDEIRAKYQPRTLSVIAPEIPRSFSARCAERQSDCYYILDLEEFRPPGPLRRIVRRAGERLTVAQNMSFTERHTVLAREFVRRVKPGLRIETLLERMPAYLNGNEHAVVLEALDEAGNLSAFYVVDLAAPPFAVYVIGCYSRKQYVPGASDLLLSETIRICREAGKDRIHLGLGVNPGIRRFKEKWGGVPGLRYEMCEVELKKPSVLDIFRSMSRKQ